MIILVLEFVEWLFKDLCDFGYDRYFCVFYDLCFYEEGFDVVFSVVDMEC